MAPPDYSSYLAAALFTESRPVSYRQLARAQKVHPNIAKKMLWAFWDKENKRKQGSVWASWLIEGSKRESQAQAQTVHSETNGSGTLSQMSAGTVSEDAGAMEVDSSQMDSGHEVHALIIVGQEGLEEEKRKLERIVAVSVYSLHAGVVKDLYEIAECNRALGQMDGEQEPPVLRNSLAKKRTTSARPVAAAAPAKASAPKPSTTAASKPTSVQSAASKSANVQPAAVKPSPLTKSSTASAKDTETNATTTTPADLERQSSALFKSFAKAPPKKPTSATVSTSATPTATQDQDAAMTGLSSGSEDEGFDDEKDGQAEVSGGKSRKQREQELEAMMDVEDEDGEKAKPRTEPVEREASPDWPDATEEDDAGAETKEEPGQAAAKAETENSGPRLRKRARRRVPKKTTVKDEEGYLITKEELVWESYSESDGEKASATAAKTKTSASASASSAAPAAKKAKVLAGAGAGAGAKKGQGSIMSFFGKK